MHWTKRFARMEGGLEHEEKLLTLENKLQPCEREERRVLSAEEALECFWRHPAPSFWSCRRQPSPLLGKSIDSKLSAPKQGFVLASVRPTPGIAQRLLLLVLQQLLPGASSAWSRKEIFVSRAKSSTQNYVRVN